MDQIPSNTPVLESKPGPAGWLQVWMKAFTKPAEQTFIDITESPDAVAKTAYIWVFIVGTISGIVRAILQGVYMAMGVTPMMPIPGLEQFQQPTTAGDPSSALVAVFISICSSPIAGLLSVLFFAIGVAITQWIAKAFGGTGTYDKLAYAVAAITVPYTLITVLLSLFSAIPYVGYCIGAISFGLGLYVIYLQVTAVKAVNRFGWGAAAGSVLIPGFIVLFFCACVVVGSIALFGPIIGDAFNQGFAP